MDGLRDRAVLIKFTDRVWIGGTIDRKVSHAVEEEAGAKKGSGHYWLRLVPKAALNTRINLGSDARTYHYANTLPWLEGGIRTLPIANFNDYMKEMRRRKALADAEADKFFANYEAWIADAKKTQGKLFNADRYPTVANLKEKFGFELDVIPLPNIADWRVDLGDEQVAELRKDVEKKMAGIQAEGLAELQGQLHTMLEAMATKLDDPKGIFRDTFISNVKAMTERIGKLNISDDKKLEAARKATAEKLAVLSPATLRTDMKVRAAAAKDARAIMKTMQFYMGKGKELPAAKEPAPEPAHAGNGKTNGAGKAKRVLTPEQKEARNLAARNKRKAKHEGQATA